MYYCNSRYYVPEWCRWLTPDGPSFLMPDTLNGMNLFAYCGNDPVNDCDMTGNLSITVTCVLISAGISFVTEAYHDYKRDKKLFNSDKWYREYAGAIVGGAVSGLGKGFLSSVGFGVAGDMIDAVISGEFQKKDDTFDFVATTIASNVLGCCLGEIASSVGKRFASTIKANQIYKSKATMKNSTINKELRKITNDLNIGAKKATVQRIADELYSSGKWEFGERLARIIGLAF